MGYNSIRLHNSFCILRLKLAPAAADSQKYAIAVMLQIVYAVDNNAECN